jgi:hypothetical protein
MFDVSFPLKRQEAIRYATMSDETAETLVNGSNESNNGGNQNQNNEQKNKLKQRQRQKRRQEERQKEKKKEMKENLKDNIESIPKNMKKEENKPNKNKNNKSQNQTASFTASSLSPAALLDSTGSLIEQSIDVDEAKKLKKKQKRQQQRQRKRQMEKQKRLDSFEVEQRNKLPVHKLTIRKLPPRLSKNSFIKKVFTENPEFKEYICEIYYVNGYYPETQFEQSVPSRCYINCINDESMMMVGRGIKQMSFTNDLINNETENETENENDNENENENNNENHTNVDSQIGSPKMYDEEMETYSPIVEKSFYQHMPGFVIPKDVESEVKVDTWEFFNNKLDDIAIYRRFCELISGEDRKQLPANIFEYEKQFEAKKKAVELAVKQKTDTATATGKNKKNKNKNKKKNKKTKTEEVQEVLVTPEEKAKLDEIKKKKKKEKKKRKREKQRQEKREAEKVAKQQTVT